MFDPAVLVAITALEEPDEARTVHAARMYSVGRELVSAFYPLGDAGEIYLLVRDCEVLAQSVTLGRPSSVLIPHSPPVETTATARIIWDGGDVMVAALDLPDGETVMAVVHRASGNMEIVRSDFVRNDCE